MRKRWVGAIVVLAALSTSLGFALVLGVGWVDGVEGLCFYSPIYGENESRPYSVLFYSVNFTYLGTTYDYGNATDFPLTAHVLIGFSDGTAEPLSLWYERYPDPYGRMNLTTHVGPRALVASGAAFGAPQGWRFIVAPWSFEPILHL